MFKKVIFILSISIGFSCSVVYAAEYYPPIPWQHKTDQATLPMPAPGCSGLFSTPQTVVVARTFYQPELVMTSDMIAVPGHYLDDPGTISANCSGDLASIFKNNVGLMECTISSCQKVCEKGVHYPDKSLPDCTKIQLPLVNIPQAEKDYCQAGFMAEGFSIEKCKTACDSGVLQPLGNNFQLGCDSWPEEFKQCCQTKDMTTCNKLPKDGDIGCDVLQDPFKSCCKQVNWAQCVPSMPVSKPQPPDPNLCIKITKTNFQVPPLGDKDIQPLKQYCYDLLQVGPHGNKAASDIEACQADCNQDAKTPNGLGLDKALCPKITLENFQVPPTDPDFQLILNYCSALQLVNAQNNQDAVEVDVSDISAIQGFAKCINNQMPETCKNPGTPILGNDGRQDLNDLYLPDKMPAGNQMLIADDIPDPVDSAFLTASSPTKHFLPIDATVGIFSGGSLKDVAILNHLPLKENYWPEVEKNVDQDPMKYIFDLMGFPFPGFVYLPEAQVGGPLFLTAEVEKAPVYNTQNETMTKEDEPDQHKPSYKNYRSSPVAIRTVSLPGTNPGFQDLAVLHQTFYHPSVDPSDKKKSQIGVGIMQMMQSILPGIGDGYLEAKDYCTNLTGDGNFPGEVPGNKFSKPIDVGFMGSSLSILFGPLVGELKVTLPVKNHILGYTTSHQNKNGLYEKMPVDPNDIGSDYPSRFCVGKTPVDMVTGLNLDGVGENDDMVVANYGGLSTGLVQPNLKWPGLAVDVGGGLTFIKGFKGNDATEVQYIPIAPTPGSQHIQHYIHVACGNVNGIKDATGKDLASCIATGIDGLGLHANLDMQELYQMPDVIRSDENTAPDFGGQCNGQCDGKDGTATYDNISLFKDGEWQCTKVKDKLSDPNDPNSLVSVNPAHPEESVDAALYNIYQCSGTAIDPTCPVFQPDHAVGFVYKADYLVQEGLVVSQTLPDAWQCGTPSPPTDIKPMGTIDCAVPDFESWHCEYVDKEKDNIPEDKRLFCRGRSKLKTFPGLLVPIGPTGPKNPYLKAPVQRDALYACGYSFSINRDSEFAVYMNDGKGNFGSPHYVNLSKSYVPRIVPDFPVDLSLTSEPLKYNEPDKGKPATMTITNTLNVVGANDGKTIGLGPWPFHAVLADIVLKSGVSGQDGCADVVMALNNTHHVAVIPSLCKDASGKPIQEPFTDSAPIYIDASTPKLKSDLEAIVGPLVTKLKDPTQTLTESERMSLLIAMMSGTSFVSVPTEPIHGLNELNVAAVDRGIVALHGFPWRVLVAAVNSIEVPIEVMGQIKDLIQGMSGNFSMGNVMPNLPAEIPAIPGFSEDQKEPKP